MKGNLAKKISIIGTGFVGSTTAYTLMMSGLVSELVLIDVNKSKAEGEVMDLNHGMPFVSPVEIYAGEYKDCANSDIIIITAGVNQKPGETRIHLLNRNVEVFKSILSEITKYNNNCILLVVTNPVDILTYVTHKLSGFPSNKVIGSGTVLDTARFRYLLSEQANVDTRNVHAYIIGEHGDTEVPAWSLAKIAGLSLEQFCAASNKCEESISKQEIFDNVKNAAYNIINRKGATYYAVALAVRRIVEAILRNENSILTVSSLINGKFGLEDVCLSLPTIVNSNGIDRVLDIPLSKEEEELLIKSGNTLKDIIKSIDI